MHLDHKIPWNTVASHFTFVRDNPARNNRTDLSARGLPGQAKALNHFARVLIATIREFSKTEREKYPAPDELPSSGKLFDDDVLTKVEAKYNLGPYARNSASSNPLSAEHQDIEYWIRQASSIREGGSPSYTTANGDLADALKMLIAVNEMTAVLRLANHQSVPLVSLNNLSWGHSFGFTHVADNALSGYLILNIAEAVKFSAKPGSSDASFSLLELNSFKYFADYALPDFDFPTQNVPHRAFWSRHGIQCAASNLTGSWDALSAVGEELESVKEYLKMCFELLYRYDMIMLECGADPKWMERIVDQLGWWGANSNRYDVGGDEAAAPLQFV